MKILLDIDGVMIPAKPWESYDIAEDGFGLFSPLAVLSLNSIINLSDNSEIILTTSHKHNFTISEWEIIFKNRGVSPIEISRLKTNSLTIKRIDEIKNWHTSNVNIPFIIIDDDKGLNNLKTDFKDNHLIITNPIVGLNQKNFEMALQKIKRLKDYNP